MYLGSHEFKKAVHHRYLTDNKKSVLEETWIPAEIFPSKILSSSFESRLVYSKRNSDISSSVNNVLQGCPLLCLQWHCSYGMPNPFEDRQTHHAQTHQGCHLDLKHTYKKKEVQFRMMQTKVGFQISPETITWNESITFHSKTCKTSTLRSTIHYDHSTLWKYTQ